MMDESSHTQVTVTETTETHTTSTAGAVTVCSCNVGYFKSWQGILKLIKIICFFSMLICSGLRPIPFPLAVSVIGFLLELTIFILYFLGVNYRCLSAKPVVSILLLVYHILLTVLVFAAVIQLGVFLSAPRVGAYNAFAMLALTCLGMEIYFNVVWIKDGPELVALPCC